MEAATTSNKSQSPNPKSNPISITVFIVMFGLTGWLFYLEYLNVPAAIILTIVSIIIARSIHIADQWEKAVVLRMGKFNGLKGPGIFMIVPILDKVDKFIDQRVRVTEFKADQTLTKDTVPVMSTPLYTGLSGMLKKLRWKSRIMKPPFGRSRKPPYGI